MNDMKVKELIEKLKQLDSEKRVYIGDNHLDEDTYYRILENVRENTIEDEDGDEDVVVLTHRR